MSERPNLESLVGRTVGMRIPALGLNKTIHAKVLGVELSGLWIEAAEITETLLTAAGQTIAPRTLILFYPFSQIEYVMEFVEVPSLSGRMLRPESPA